ncbi:hypothetical protein FLW16_12370 [Microbispora sp. KK1-11]|nr:hypothetical protein FLW16_12370 [Microbispora sp. KK1-11]
MVARDENMIAALKRERAVYANQGDTDRVAQVDGQLKHYGYEGTQDADPNAPAEPPQGRTAAGERQTAEGGQGKTAAASKAKPKS